MLKEQKGITLIALVITIIVLLILAGITIAMIGSQDSAASKAGEGKARNAIGAAKDAINMQASANLTTFYEEKFVQNKTGNALTFADKQTAAEAAGTQKTSSSPAVGSTDAIEGVTFTTTSHKITITYTADSKYTAEGTVDENGVIKWEDKTSNS